MTTDVAACLKVPFPSPQAAHTELDRITRKVRRHAWKPTLEHPHPPCEVYPCDACGAWHLTSQRPVTPPAKRRSPKDAA